MIDRNDYYVVIEGELGELWKLIQQTEELHLKSVLLKCYAILLSQEYKFLKRGHGL